MLKLKDLAEALAEIRREEALRELLTDSVADEDEAALAAGEETCAALKKKLAMLKAH